MDETHARPVLASSTMRGIHLANPEPEMDWHRLAAGGIEFAYVCATYSTEKAADFAAVWSRMRSAGLRRGAYHILRHDQDAIEQAARFLAAFGLQHGDFPPALHVLGVEGKPARPIVRAMREWLSCVESELEARHGHAITPILYLSDRVWRHLERPTGFTSYPLWVVDWKHLVDPRTPSSWGRRQWTLHQYGGDSRALPGIKLPTDLDRFNIIKVGDHGSRIAQVKQLLGRAGFPAGPGDHFDANTRLSVVRFQEARGLPPDGIIGAQTFAELHWP